MNLQRHWTNERLLNPWFQRRKRTWSDHSRPAMPIWAPRKTQRSTVRRTAPFWWTPWTSESRRASSVIAVSLWCDQLSVVVLIYYIPLFAEIKNTGKRSQRAVPVVGRTEAIESEQAAKLQKHPPKPVQLDGIHSGVPQSEGEGNLPPRVRWSVLLCEVVSYPWRSLKSKLTNKKLLPQQPHSNPTEGRPTIWTQSRRWQRS